MSEPYYTDDGVTLHHGDALTVIAGLPDQSVDCIVTSPPYLGLRDYGVAGTVWPAVTYAPMHGLPVVDVPAMQCPLGHEPDPLAYIAHLVLIFRDARRVLADDGTLWLNLGDSYARQGGARRGGGSMLQGRKHGHAQEATTNRRRKPGITLPEKNLLGIPWRAAYALQADGWILRNDIIWSKPNGMPESVRDRVAAKHEHVFLLAKSARYHFDLAPIREPHAQTSLSRAAPHRADPGRAAREGAPYRGISVSGQTFRLDQMNHVDGRNPGDVWTIPTVPFAGAHFAVFPPALAEKCILAGCEPGGTVLDPFSGSGTTGMVAARHGHRYVGIDVSKDYLDLSLRTRLAQGALLGEDAS